jgi:serine/threonine protein phosphatase PrpC
MNQDPLEVIITYLLILLFLVVVRRILLRLKQTPEVLIGNAQILGDRNEQEDSFSTSITDEGVLAVLADGMGGYSNGKMASSLVVKTFIREFTRSNGILPIDVFLRNTSYLSNEKLLSKRKGEKTGTTLVAVVISEGFLYWVSVGDSAIALYRNGQFFNLNKKHIFQSVLEERYLSGKISMEEVLQHPKRKRLTNFVGHDELSEVETNQRFIKLFKGDRVILCSDGVYNSITEIEIEESLKKSIHPNKVAEEIVERIQRKRMPEQDNATVVILERNNSD